MTEPEVKSESLYDPKFVERWGKIYLDRYVKNSQEAIKWAIEFFPDDLVTQVAEAAAKEMKKRGIIIKP